MKITCSACGTPYEVDDSRVPPGGLTMKCTQCHTPIHVGQPVEDGWDLPAPVAASPSRFYLRRRTGKVFGPFLVQAIASMLEQGKLEGTEQVSTDSQTWMPMSSVAALRPFARGDDVDLPTPKRAPMGALHSALQNGSPAPRAVPDLPGFNPPLMPPPTPTPPSMQPLSSSMELEDDLSDLPAPKGFSDLPAPKAIVPPPPTDAGFDLGDFDQLPLSGSPPVAPSPITPPPPGFLPNDIADLPMPKDGIADLPGLPATPKPAPPWPGIGMEYGQLDLGGDDTPELPLPKEGVTGLPTPKRARGHVPPPPGFAPMGGISDLPAPSQGISDLPVPKEGIVDLPVPKHGGVDLAAPKQGITDLLTPKPGGDDLDLTGGLPDLPMSARKAELELGDSTFDLPMPKDDLFAPDVDADLVQPKPGAEDAIDVVAPRLGGMVAPVSSTFKPPQRPGGPVKRPIADIDEGGPDVAPVIQRPSMLKRKLLTMGLGTVGLVLVVGFALGLLTDFGFFGMRLLTGSYGDTKRGKLLLVSARKAMALDTSRAYDQAATDCAQAIPKLPESLDPVALQLQALSASLVRFGNNLSRRSAASDLARQLAATQPPPSEAEKAQALWALALGDLASALTRLAKISSKEPGDVQAAIYLGWAQLAKKNFKDAATTFKRALSADPAHAAALFGLARAESALDTNASALLTVNKTLQASPRHTGALLLRTALLLEDGKKPEAEKTLRQAMAGRNEASRRELGQIHSQLGDIEQARGNTDEARAQYVKALKIEPQTVTAQIGLGQVYFTSRKLNESLDHFQKALASDPKSLAAATGVARCFILLSQPLKAQKVLQQMQAHRPGAQQIPFLLGRVELSVNNLDAAAEYFRKALKQAPTYFPPYLYLSQVYVKQGKPREAMALLADANTQLPGSPLVRDAEGVVLLSTGQPAMARSKFEEALRLDPSHNDARFHLGVALMALDQLDPAGEAFLAVRKKDANYPGLAEKIGELYIAQKNYKEAALAYDRALEVDNPSIETRLGAAAAYNLFTQYDKALDQSKAVLQADPTVSRARALRAEARLGQGKLDDALVEIRQAVERDRRVEYLIIMAQVHTARKETADAIDAYRDALKLEPARLDVRFARAKLQVRGGAVRDGMKELKKVLKSQPNLAEAHLYMGLALQENGKEQQALASYHTATVKDPTLAEPYYRMGQILFDTRRVPAAVAALKKAVTLADESTSWRAEAYYTLGTAAHGAGLKKLAIDALQTFVQIAPSGAVLRKDALKQMRQLGVQFKKPED